MTERLTVLVDVAKSFFHLLQNTERVLDTTTFQQLKLGNCRERADSAMYEFREAVELPTVVLATTGTTSGGKSSLVNFLCGAELMPTAVQEMSAGTVHVDHHPLQRKVKIEATSGARWETGEWECGTADEVRRRLAMVMETYRDQLAPGKVHPAPPRIFVTFPTRIGSSAGEFGLPEGVRVRILDLPGLKYVGDEKNAAVVREQCRSALCLVTYNSEETDPVKREELLRQVVRQVQELQGSPARMLFLANRIDVFLKDDHPEESRKRFLERIRTDIRTHLADALPEHKADAEQVEVHALSSYPALLAHLVANGTHEAQDFALRKLDKFFGPLIPEEISAELPRKIEAATAAARSRVAQAVRGSSFGGEFDLVLRHHLATHLPDLILPPLEANVLEPIAQAVGIISPVVNARINGTERSYKLEVARLEKAHDDLKSVRQDLVARLDPLRSDAIEKAKIPIVDLRQAALQVEKDQGLEQHSLSPLFDWDRKLNEEKGEIFEAVRQALLGGAKRLLGPVADRLEVGERDALDHACSTLQSAGYSNWAAKGGPLRVKRTNQENLNKLSDGMDELGAALSKVLRSRLGHVASREAERIQAALEVLLKAQAREIETRSISIAKDLAGLLCPPPKTSRIRQRLDWSLELRHAFEKEIEKVHEQVGTRKVTSYERRWYTAWLYRHEVTEQEPIMGEVVYVNADIPSIDKVLGSFEDTFKAAKPMGRFLDWLGNQLDMFEQDIRRFHEEQLARYRARLDEAYGRAEKVRDDELARLRDLQAELTELEREARRVRFRS